MGMGRGRIIFIFLGIILPLLACAKTVIQDKGLSAVEGNDLTGLIEACGSQLVPGLTFCRITEGQSTEGLVYLVGPRTNCKRTNCVEFKFFALDGSVAYGDGIPKGQFRLGVPWNKLIKRDKFQLSDRGFWLLAYTVYWIDENGNEHESKSEAELYLRVLKIGYMPLNEVVSDGNFAWDFSTRNGERVKLTTGMRTYVSPRPPAKPKTNLFRNWGVF